MSGTESLEAEMAELLEGAINLWIGSSAVQPPEWSEWETKARALLARARGEQGEPHEVGTPEANARIKSLAPEMVELLSRYAEVEPPQGRDYTCCAERYSSLHGHSPDCIWANACILIARARRTGEG